MHGERATKPASRASQPRLSETLLLTQIQRQYKPRQRSPKSICLLALVHPVCYIARSHGVSCLQWVPNLAIFFISNPVGVRIAHQLTSSKEASAAPPKGCSARLVTQDPSEMLHNVHMHTSGFQDNVKCCILWLCASKTLTECGPPYCADRKHFMPIQSLYKPLLACEFQ